MTLPLSRTQNAGPGIPIESNLGNDLQDMIIGARHGSESWLYPAINGNPSIGAWTLNGFFVNAPGGAQVWDLGLSKLPVGARITGVTLYHRRFGGTLQFDLIVTDLTGVFSETTTNLAMISAGVVDAATAVAVTPVTLPITSHAYIRCTSGANLDRFYAAAVTFDH